MDEAKTFVNMSISTMIAAMFVGAAMSLITFGYIMWTYFARQDTANSRMSYYANFAAYDNQTIGGADVLGLLARADSYQIFVIFLDTEEPATAPSETDPVIVLDDITNVKLATDADDKVYVYYDPSGYASYTKAYWPSYTNAIPVCESATQVVKTLMADKTMTDIAADTVNLHDKDKMELVEFLTDSVSGLGNKAVGKENGFAAFKANVIYSGDGSTDIIGVALTRAHKYVGDFCMD